MKYLRGHFPIVNKRNLAKDVYELTIYSPDIVARAQPGQFVHIGLPGHSLRRPISICEIDQEQNTFRLVFVVKGSGTRDLAEHSEHAALDILGPLGHGFTLLNPDSRVLLIGGGIGVPPLVELSHYYGRQATVICGFRSQSSVILQECFKQSGAQSFLCTDDGSAGIHGLVSKPMEEILASGEAFDMIYSCGPMPMMKAVSEVAARYKVPCEVSLEQHMGCGIGACLVCTCQIRSGDNVEYQHVCKDGPVFNSQEVVW